MSPIFFWSFIGICFLMILLSIFVVASKRPLTSAIYLLLNLGFFGVLFLMLDAPLIAVIQWLVYVGAVMVLFIFVILLFQFRDVRDDWIQSYRVRLNAKNLIIIGLAVLILGFLFKFMVLDEKFFKETYRAGVVQLKGGILEVAQLLFSKHVVAFEVLSLVLLAALVGAIAIARRHRT